MQNIFTLVTGLLCSICFFASSSFALTWDEDSNPEEMEAGDSTLIYIIGDCPPYTWMVESEGFTIGAVVTQGETNTLISNDEMCGSATISVADGCGEKITGYLRGGVGFWDLIVDEMCGELSWPEDIPRPIGCCSTCGKCSEVVVGKFRYRDCWMGGTWWAERYKDLGCSKWPYTEDLDGQTCRDPGYYPLRTMRGLFDHQMWEWKCPNIALNLPANIDNNGCLDEQ